MTAKGGAKWDRNECESALFDAAQLIFNPQILPEFVAFRPNPFAPGGNRGFALPPEQKIWSKGMASAYVKSKTLSAFVNQCIEESHAGLKNSDGQDHLREFSRRGVKVSPDAVDVLKKARAFLLSAPSDSRWLGLVFFSLSRAISTTSRRSFDEDVWTDASLFAMQLERAFCDTDGREFSRIVGSLNNDFPQQIGPKAGIGLATMVSLDSTSSFFQGIDPSKLH